MQKISVKDVLFDLDFLMKEIYHAEISKEKDGLKVNFENGESFYIEVKKLP